MRHAVAALAVLAFTACGGEAVVDDVGTSSSTGHLAFEEESAWVKGSFTLGDEVISGTFETRFADAAAPEATTGRWKVVRQPLRARR